MRSFAPSPTHGIGVDSPRVLRWSAAARDQGLQLHFLQASSERDFDTVFATLPGLRAAGLVVASLLSQSHDDLPDLPPAQPIYYCADLPPNDIQLRHFGPRYIRFRRDLVGRLSDGWQRRQAIQRQDIRRFAEKGNKLAPPHVPPENTPSAMPKA